MEEENKYERFGKNILMIAGVAGLIFSYLFLFNNGDIKCGPINTEEFGHYGDLLGGFIGVLVAIASALLLFATLKEQRTIYTKQLIETKFFELLKLHRENIKEMTTMGHGGRAVFIKMKDEFHDLYNGISSSLPNCDTTQKAQIAFLILFFGVNNSSKEYLNQQITNLIGENAFKLFEGSYLEKLIEKHKNIKDANKEKPKFCRKYLKYDGHQSRLGHYYRHLFQIVTYINNQKSLSYGEKYRYIKTLRAQLSTHEQALFLYNSISPMGRNWELAKETDRDKLITKYNLIKNLPPNFTGDINPIVYYPFINYEYLSIFPDERKRLNSIYKNEVTVDEDEVDH